MNLPRLKSSGSGQNFHECADCGTSNPQWALLNHGVLVCDECCLAHQTLTRCYSSMKSLKKSYWPETLIDIVYELVRSNMNQIWEENLPDESTSANLILSPFKQTKKPNSKSSYENRLNFIKMKYENLSFIQRSNYSSIEDLNQQLLSSVKTSNYESTLKILSQGADANYRNPEDGLMCIHRAVLSNKIGQIELLCLYGADVTGLDRNGNTAYDLAKQNNLDQIADRLIELQFEATDEFSFFLCNKRPDHKTNQHFLVPDLKIESEVNTINNYRLTELSDNLLDELCMDVYDEIDRRSFETIWRASVPAHLANVSIPFLAIKSFFPQTRNQLRQKLAKFNLMQFSDLVYDLLMEARKRFNSNRNELTTRRKWNHLVELETLIEEEEENDYDYNEIEEDPLYDKVASDYDSIASDLEPTRYSKQPQNRALIINIDKTLISESECKDENQNVIYDKLNDAQSALNSIIKSLNQIGCSSMESIRDSSSSVDKENNFFYLNLSDITDTN